MSKLVNALLLGLAAALGGATLPAAAEPPPIAAFFKKPQIRSPKLSPSGRYLAVQSAGKNDRTWLAVIDLQTLAAPKIVAGFSDADIYSHHWVNEDRLVFDITDSPDGTTNVMAQGLWAVDRDGSNFKQLISSFKSFVSNSSSHLNDRRLDINYVFVRTLPGKGDEVLVLRRRWYSDPESTGAQLSRLNTRTGVTRSLSGGLPDSVVDWTLDHQGEPRAVEALAAGRISTYLKQADGSWKPWQSAPRFDDYDEPYWFGPNGQALVRAGHRGFMALFQLDPITLKREPEPFISFKGYDFNGALIVDDTAGRLLGLRYETDAPATLWFDPEMKATQAEIDRQLPGTVNQIQCARCLDATHLIVTALSDQLPPSYYLYKPADKSIQRLAGGSPEIKARDMGQRDVYRFKARDGLEIPVLVTQAAGKARGPRPAVVLVHGGPFVRGTHWPWERDAQFLASRGYVVLEPEFRGSTGYGGRHFRAGWKQWGLAMQDDIADTLAWAVKQGWVDPARVCIAGASYGGYAALMGAVSQADLFKCAVNWVGVSDLGLMSSINWSDFSEEWKQYGMKALVGDPAQDAAQFKATSPLQRAGEIKIPLLMAYGGEDRRVPIKHGTAMKSALRSDQPLEWVVYPEEGHGWFNLKTNEDFWGRVERFLATHIGPAK